MHAVLSKEDIEMATGLGVLSKERKARIDAAEGAKKKAYNEELEARQNLARHIAQIAESVGLIRPGGIGWDGCVRSTNNVFSDVASVDQIRNALKALTEHLATPVKLPNQTEIDMRILSKERCLAARAALDAPFPNGSAKVPVKPKRSKKT